MKKHIVYLWFVLLPLFLLSGCRPQTAGKIVSISNGKIALGFDRESGVLLSFRDLTHRHEFLETDLSGRCIWKIDFLRGSGPETIDGADAGRFQLSRPGLLSLILTWDDFAGNKGIKIKAVVKLDEDRPLSYWKISVSGIEGEKITKVIFPKIAAIRDLGDEYLAVPSWMGQIMKHPRAYLSTINKGDKKFEWVYPGPLSLQCLALYSPDQYGFYASCNDTSNYRKSFSFTLDTLNTLVYQLSNYPAFDSTRNGYAPAYEAVIGSFMGDWITAAGRYRAWAAKQNWCKESRLKIGLTPSWLEKTGIWVWNRGRSENVLIPAVDLEQRTELPVSVFWHWWHNCSYDDGFPEYLPPREGKRSFIRAMDEAHEKKIKAIVYMNALQWGTSTQSWKSKNAGFYAVKDIHGNLKSHVYNIFTGNALANMCVATQFWKNQYTSLAVRALNTYHVDGIYMDQACLTRMCYDTNHGHPPGGGNYWIRNFGALTAQIRLGTRHQGGSVLAGEGGGESWLPYLDAFLTLQVSRERYAGIGGWETIPFFQAVYHQYAITYGNYSSLLVPPYDELWPKEFAPKDPLKLLDESYNKQFMMEQARSFVWGMQPTIANYQDFLASERKEEIGYLINLARVRYQALKYLLYGKFVRSPQTDIPEEEINISRLSIYAGKAGKRVTSFLKRVPMVYTGTWQSEDNSIGIALASISEDPYDVSFNFSANDYGLPAAGEVYLIDINGRKKISGYAYGQIQIRYTLPPKSVCVIKITGNE